MRSIADRFNTDVLVSSLMLFIDNCLDYPGFQGSYHSGRRFSTWDRDQDRDPSNCAHRFGGGWWFDRCHPCNLNGGYVLGGLTDKWMGIIWFHWKGKTYSLKRASMKMRLMV